MARAERMPENAVSQKMKCKSRDNDEGINKVCGENRVGKYAYE